MLAKLLIDLSFGPFWISLKRLIQPCSRSKGRGLPLRRRQEVSDMCWGHDDECVKEAFGLGVKVVPDGKLKAKKEQESATY